MRHQHDFHQIAKLEYFITPMVVTCFAEYADEDGRTTSDAAEVQHFA